MNNLLKYVSGFEVRWGNHNKLPFIGWVDPKVSWTSSTNPEVIVPFLATPDTLYPMPLQCHYTTNAIPRNQYHYTVN